MKLIRIILALVIGWFLFGTAITYGGVWDLMANPHQNVEVAFSNGTTHKGSLSKDWGRQWVLVSTSESGNFKTITFTDEGIQMMSFPRLEKSESLWLSTHWRAILPVFLVLMGAVTFCIGYVLPRRKSS